jgi:hypothetical protein
LPTVVDAQAGKLGAARGDLVTMEWTRDRFADAVAAGDRTRIDTALVRLSEDVQDEDLVAVSAEASRLRDTAAGLRIAT